LRLFRHTGNESILEGQVTKMGVGFVMKRKIAKLGRMFGYKSPAQIIQDSIEKAEKAQQKAIKDSIAQSEKQRQQAIKDSIKQKTESIDDTLYMNPPIYPTHIKRYLIQGIAAGTALGALICFIITHFLTK
jgi:serine/threonine-protein kinase